ncbi:MAG: PA2778 family cysteine peptidase [Pseudomonas sp.]|uniref:PA2778 family cysteine peptidase n=1 Tax=Pseudomonas sp. TaxID=306 RepID=UPI0033991F37
MPRNLCGLLLVLLLGGCSSAPLPPGIARLPERVELSAVPFFAQTAYQGAPGALAILLLQQGVTTTPGLVAKALHLPEQEAQLQQRIPEVVRGHGLLVYPLSGGLSELLSQVAAGFPVLVRYGQGGSWMGAPRYAVLVGYDRGEQTVLLRAGTSRRWVVDFDDFQAAWQAEGHWALLAQPPAQLPADVDPLRWRAAAADLENAGQALAASNAYRAAAALPAP